MRPIRVVLAGLIGMGLAFAGLLVMPRLAGADPTCYTSAAPGAPAVGNDCVTPAVLNNQVSEAPEVLANTAAQTTSGSLALTGANVAGLVAIAVVALVGGGLLVRVTRRRRSIS